MATPEHYDILGMRFGVNRDASWVEPELFDEPAFVAWEPTDEEIGGVLDGFGNVFSDADGGL